jgi:hypothetical protein
MKIKYRIIVSLVLLFVIGCKEKKQQPASVDEINKDSLTALFTAIAVKENTDFYKKDITAWSSHFAHTPSVYWICVEDDVTLRATGWDDLSQFVGSWMKQNPVPEADSLLKKEVIEDVQTVLGDKVAFLRYKKNKFMPDGSKKIMLENRTFELINNEWKIIGMTSAPGYNSKGSEPNVFIHTTAKQ